MKLIFFSVIAIGFIISLVVLLATNQVFGIGLPSTIKKIDSKMGFSIQYPSSWVFLETMQGSHGDEDVIAFISDPPRTYPQITIYRNKSEGISLSELVNWGEEKLSNRNISIVEKTIDNSIIENNSVVYRYKYHRTTYWGSENIICLDLYTIRAQLGYSILSCSLEKDWALAESYFVVINTSFAVDGE